MTFWKFSMCFLQNWTSLVYGEKGPLGATCGYSFYMNFDQTFFHRFYTYCHAWQFFSNLTSNSNKASIEARSIVWIVPEPFAKIFPKSFPLQAAIVCIEGTTKSSWTLREIRQICICDSSYVQYRSIEARAFWPDAEQRVRLSSVNCTDHYLV